MKLTNMQADTTTQEQSAQVIYVPTSTTSNSASQLSGSNSDSESSAISTNENNSSQTNVQVNSSSNRIEFGNGAVAIPETTLSISAYGNGNDQGFVATVNVPLGGRARRSGNAYAKAIAARQTLAAQADLLTTCAKIVTSGIVIDYSNPEFAALKPCQSVRVMTAVIPSTPTALMIKTQPKSEATIAYEAEMQSMRLEILRLKLDAHKAERGTAVKAKW